MVLAVCALCTVFVLWSILTTPSWYVAKQAYRYPYLLLMFREQFSAGQWYPRWLPSLTGGYGYPTFVYYPPGFWFLAQLVGAYAADVVVACKAALVAMMLIGGVGAYRLARSFCAHKYATVVVAWFYLTPYFARLIYDRGSLAELAGAMLCPWAFFHLVAAARAIGTRRAAPHAIWLGTCVAGVVYAHPVVAVWLIVCLVVCGFGLALDSGKYRRVVALFSAAGVLAAGLSAAYWVPAVSLSEYVSVGRAVGLPALRSLSLSTVFSVADTFAGAVLPALAVVGAWVGRRSWFVVASIVCCALLIAYVTQLSIAVRSSVVGLQYLQMPMRVFSVVATLQLVCVGCLFGGFGDRVRSSIAPILAIGLSVLLGAQAEFYKISAPLDFAAFRASRERTFENMTHTDEFMPRRAVVEGLHARRESDPIAFALKPAAIRVRFNRAGIDIGLDVAAEGPTTIVVNQFYFPGWVVEVDGVPAARCRTTAVAANLPMYCEGRNGRIAIRLPYGGEHFLRAVYEGVPGAIARNIICTVVVLICVVSICRLSRGDSGVSR